MSKGVAAGAAVLDQKSADVVLGYPLMVYWSHWTESLIRKFCTKAYSDQWISKYEIILLGSENIQLKRCSVLNPATLLPDLPKNGEPLHDCVEVVNLVDMPRMDSKDTPNENPDLVLFSDGSSYLCNGIRSTGATWSQNLRLFGMAHYLEILVRRVQS